MEDSDVLVVKHDAIDGIGDIKTGDDAKDTPGCDPYGPRLYQHEAEDENKTSYS